MQFRWTTISFNGINSTRYGLYLCNVVNGLDRQLGTGRSFTMEGSNLISVDDDNPTFDIQLVKLDKHNDPAPITEKDLFEIKKWLFATKEFKPLIIDQQSIVYYGMFVNGQIWQNECNQGYLTLQFQLNAGHAYTTQQNSVFKVNGTREITVRSKHNYEVFSKIDIEIELAGGNSFTVENMSSGQKMVLSNIPSGTTRIRIYNEDMEQIVDLDNPTKLLRQCFNKVFLHLVNGDNKIRITGNGTVKFINQGKILI